MIHFQCTEFFLLTCPALINLVWAVLIKIPTIQNGIPDLKLGYYVLDPSIHLDTGKKIKS